MGIYWGYNPLILTIYALSSNGTSKYHFGERIPTCAFSERPSRKVFDMFDPSLRIQTPPDRIGMRVPIPSETAALWPYTGCSISDTRIPRRFFKSHNRRVRLSGFPSPINLSHHVPCIWRLNCSLKGLLARICQSEAKRTALPHERNAGAAYWLKPISKKPNCH